MVQKRVTYFSAMSPLAVVRVPANKGLIEEVAISPAGGGLGGGISSLLNHARFFGVDNSR